jgi:hypothetical protein
MADTNGIPCPVETADIDILNGSRNYPSSMNDAGRAQNFITILYSLQSSLVSATCQGKEPQKISGHFLQGTYEYGVLYTFSTWGLSFPRVETFAPWPNPGIPRIFF